ncbi:MAG: hypothetical protein ABI808_04145 [Pseudonocardiales bacterium]
MIGARARRFVAAAALALVSTLIAAPAGVALDPVPDATAALRISHLYIAPDVTGVHVDPGLAAALPKDLKIAVLPASAGSADVLATETSRGLGASPQRPLTIGVVTVAEGRRVNMRAVSSKYCRGAADALAQAAASAGRAEFQSSGDLTSIIQDFAQRLSDAQVDRNDCSTAGASSSAGTVWAWIVVIAALSAGGIGGLLLYRHRKRQIELDLARTRARPYLDKLAHEINTLDPKDDQMAGQALADAAERFTSAGGQFAAADSVETYELARRTVLEGLYATRSAREALGLDPGLPLPPIEQSQYEQLQKPREVTVQGQHFQGYPNYAPGAPYYFGGGWGVPGGWYAVAFWKTLLLGSALDAGLYGGGLFGGYDEDYEGGQDPVREDFSSGCVSGSDGDSAGGGGDGG